LDLLIPKAKLIEHFDFKARLKHCISIALIQPLVSFILCPIPPHPQRNLRHFIFNLILRPVIKARTRIIYLFIRMRNWFCVDYYMVTPRFLRPLTLSPPSRLH